MIKEASEEAVVEELTRKEATLEEATVKVAALEEVPIVNIPPCLEELVWATLQEVRKMHESMGCLITQIRQRYILTINAA